MAIHAVGRSASRRGFTLVELLVVLGIVAVLAGLVLSGLHGARDSARRAACANNLRQIAALFTRYAVDNEQRFPFSAQWDDVADPEDWLHWRVADDPSKSAIVRRAGGFQRGLFVCPSDDTDFRPRPASEPYPYSYLFNWRLASDNPNARRVTAVQQASQKILLLEGDARTLDDGRFDPTMRGAIEDPLGTAHDRSAVPEWNAGWGPLPPADRPDRNGRGNIAFVDGHVEYLPRSVTWERKHFDPCVP